MVPTPLATGVYKVPEGKEDKNKKKIRTDV